MYARVIRRKARPGGVKGISDAVKGDAPDFTNVSGLKAYYVVDLGKDDVGVIGIFDDKESADRWASNAREYAQRKGLPKHLEPKAIFGFGGSVRYSRP